MAIIKALYVVDHNGIVWHRRYNPPKHKKVSLRIRRLRRTPETKEEGK